MIYYVLMVMTVGVIGVAVCFRSSSWWRHESVYWQNVAWMTKLSPELEKEFTPIVRWAQSNRPGLFGRLKTWENPPTRMGKAR